MNIITDISALFEAIATNHPSIGHVAGTTSKFYKWSFDQMQSEGRSTMKFPNLGLSLPTHTGLEGSYTMREMGMQDNLYINVVLLNVCPVGDYDKEEEIYSNLKVVMDDIIDWLYRTAYGKNRCDWPVIEYIDLASMPYKKVGPISNSNAFGWALTLKMKGLHNCNDNSNPLILAMTP